jgi:hypothetical protein
MISTIWILNICFLSIYICINNVFDFDFSRGLSKLWRRRVEEEELEEATTFTRTIER